MRPQTDEQANNSTELDWSSSMIKTSKLLGGLLAPSFVLASLLISGVATAAGSGSEQPYTIECDDDDNCRVGTDTYVGWRTYNGNCARCHGAGGTGSSLAPDLTQRIERKNMTYEQFEAIVRDGTSGPMGVMPPWGENPNVMSRTENVWAYLQARTDGALSVGRPDKLAQEEEESGSDRPSNWD